MNPWALFEIDADLRRLIETAVDHETGEIDPAHDLAFDSLTAAREALLLDLACAIKEARAERDAIKHEANKLAERAQRCDRRADSLTRQVFRFLQPGEKLKDARASIGWRKSKAIVLMVDPGQLDDEFVRLKREPDLGKIREMLESAAEAPALDGVAKIEERVHLQVR